MALESAFFPGSVTADEWALWATLHMFEGCSGGLVTAAPGDRRVFVAPFRASFAGKFARDTEQSEVTLPENLSSNPRVDRIILKVSGGAITLTSKQGTPAANPVPPTLTTGVTGVYEFSLARVVVGPGQGALSSGDITYEATPPHRGFWYVDFLNTAPGISKWPALYYYAAPDHRSLRVNTPEGAVELADARPVRWEPVATEANWSSSLFYARAGRMVTVRGRPVRLNSGAAEPSTVGTLPAAVRPTHAIDGAAWQNLAAGVRMHGLAIETNGTVTVHPGADGPIVEGVACRFHATFPIVPPTVVQAFKE